MGQKPKRLRSITLKKSLEWSPHKGIVFLRGFCLPKNFIFFALKDFLEPSEILQYARNLYYLKSLKTDVAPLTWGDKREVMRPFDFVIAFLPPKEEVKRRLQFLKKVYCNFLKVLGEKLTGSWESSFYELSLYEVEISKLMHPVLYIGAQFELWRGVALKYPLPTHLLPTRDAISRALSFYSFIRQHYRNYDDAVSLYIQNYLNDNPQRIWLVKSILYDKE